MPEPTFEPRTTAAASNTTPHARAHTAVPTIVVVGHGMVGQRFLEALAERGLTPAAGGARVVVL
ncbi:hypothetical protein G3M53_23180, partial [Streptomyces sp. SID7982]|nr:hypothetical protein [Streptomyces sp. SID7982]